MCVGGVGRSRVYRGSCYIWGVGGGEVGFIVQLGMDGIGAHGHATCQGEWEEGSGSQYMREEGEDSQYRLKCSENYLPLRAVMMGLTDSLQSFLKASYMLR